MITDVTGAIAHVSDAATLAITQAVTAAVDLITNTVPVAVVPEILGIYAPYFWIFMIGFGFIMFTLFSGEIDLPDVEVDVDVETDGLVNAKVFSLKVISCFLMGWGFGASFSHEWITAGWELGARKYSLDGLVGMGGGIVVGWLGLKVINLLESQQSSTTFSIQSFVGRQAILDLDCSDTRIGEVSALIMGNTRHLDVKSMTGKTIKKGTLVEVVAISGTIGLVKPVNQ